MDIPRLKKQGTLKDVDNIEAKGAVNKNGRLKKGARETGNQHLNEFQCGKPKKAKTIYHFEMRLSKVER